MNEDSPAPTLRIPDFDPEDLELADLFLGSEPQPMVAPGTLAMVSVGLNSSDLAYAYLSIDPPGEAVLAREPDGPRLSRSVWIDLRPAEALELGRRLQVCGEAAARFAEAFPEEPDEAEGDGDTAVDP